MEGLEEVLFRIVTTEDDGRHLVALRDLLPGDLIFSESPSATGPGDLEVDECIVCYAHIQDSVCQKCWWPVCSEACTNSQVHQRECRLLSSCTAKGPDFRLPTRHILPLRCLLLKSNARVWDQLTSLASHGIQSLILPEQELLTDPNFKDLVTFIREDCGMSIPIEDLAAVHLACTSSSMTSRVAGRELTGMYLLAGYLTHSCIQNTRSVFKDKSQRLYVYSSVPIKKGEKITYCRLPQVIHTGTKQRRKLLRDSFLDCHCKRCCDATELGTQTSSLLCQRCEDLCLPLNPLDPQCGWVCQKCDNKMSHDFVNTLLLSLQEEGRNVVESRYQKYLAFRERTAKILPDRHYLHTAERAKFFLHLSPQSTVKENLTRITAGRELLSIVDSLEPGLSIFRESILVNLGTSLQLLLTQEIMRRQEGGPDSESLSDTQVYAAFRDAVFCFKEARLSAQLEFDPADPEIQPTRMMDENIAILEEMRAYFDSIGN